MCCVIEMEDVLVDEFDAQIVHDPMALPRNLSNVTVLVPRISTGQVTADSKPMRMLRDRGAQVIVYLWDSWTIDTVYRGRSNWYSRLRGKPRYVADFADILCVPFRDSLNGLANPDIAIARHLPLAVDTLRADGFAKDRLPLVHAYGRQPRAVTEALSDAFNRAGSAELLIHTDHVALKEIIDPYAHRRQFWKLSERATISMAYDPMATDPERFPFPIVSQRWFEALSAGCVVVGRRPDTREYGELLGWEDSTIEAPMDAGIVDFVRALLADKAKVAAIGERNAQEIRRRHDWRLRFHEFFGTLVNLS